MRTEKEMFELITGVAKADERIRSVIMLGSRANPNCPKDKYQDYDIAYFVTDINPFYNNMDWIKEKFGSPAIVQLPELMSHPLLPPQGDGHFTYLMIFEDGIRIDLSIQFELYIDDGEPAIILLDKDNLISIEANQTFFNIKPPQEKCYYDTCNQFWWCLNNVAKGIARDELPYAMEMFNHHVRDMLNQMVEWYIGINTDFLVSAGKMGKYFKKYLPTDLYTQYTQTYSDSNYMNLWKALFTACDLFKNMAIKVSEFFCFNYNHQEESKIRIYLHTVMSDLKE